MSLSCTICAIYMATFSYTTYTKKPRSTTTTVTRQQHIILYIRPLIQNSKMFLLIIQLYSQSHITDGIRSIRSTARQAIYNIYIWKFLTADFAVDLASALVREWSRVSSVGTASIRAGRYRRSVNTGLPWVGRIG